MTHLKTRKVMFIYSSSNPGKRCSSIKLQLCSQNYHKHVLNFNHVIARILDLIAAWLHILSRIMSFCQSLRFICTDLMDQLQTSFSLTSMEGNGHPRHPHTSRTIPILLTATQPDSTNSNYSDKFLLVQGVPSHTSSRKGKNDSSALQSVLEKADTPKSLCNVTVQDKDQTSS